MNTQKGGDIEFINLTGISKNVISHDKSEELKSITKLIIKNTQYTLYNIVHLWIYVRPQSKIRFFAGYVGISVGIKHIFILLRWNDWESTRDGMITFKMLNHISS